VTPFTVLHVCMGNICRSPMAERMLAHRVADRLGDRSQEFLLSESAGAGGWHAGDVMDWSASTELERRGMSHAGFRARKLLAAHIDAADLVLVATREQLEHVEGLRPDGYDRTFVLGQFGRLATQVDPDRLPPFDGTPESAYNRGVALVEAVSEIRGAGGPAPADDLDDPYGRGSAFFTRTADQISTSIDVLVDRLFGESGER
jgi:protein-tyrosine phosphatase